MPHPLDSEEAFRYLDFTMRIVGLNPVDTHRWLYRCYSLLIIISTVTFSLHMMVQLSCTVHLVRIFNILTVTLTSAAAPTKLMIVYYYSRSNLRQLRAHLSALNRRAESDPANRAIVAESIHICAGIFRLLLGTDTTAVFGYLVSGLLHHTLIFEGWMPFDWTASTSTYCGAFIYQLFGVHITMFQNVMADSYGPIYLNMLVGHMRALNRRVSRLGAVAGKSFEQNYQELVDCIEHHKQCMAAIECLRPVLSGTMFVQLMITAFVISTSAVGYSHSSRSVEQLLRLAIYSIGIMLEFLPCTWYANVLVDEMDALTTALYSCRWYDQDQRFRKSILIFMERSQMKHELLAGNIVPISLETAIAVIKFSFSLFTLLA